MEASKNRAPLCNAGQIGEDRGQLREGGRQATAQVFGVRVVSAQVVAHLSYLQDRLVYFLAAEAPQCSHFISHSRGRSATTATPSGQALSLFRIDIFFGGVTPRGGAAWVTTAAAEMRVRRALYAHKAGLRAREAVLLEHGLSELEPT